MNQSPSCVCTYTEDFDERVEIHEILRFTPELVSII